VSTGRRLNGARSGRTRLVLGAAVATVLVAACGTSTSTSSTATSSPSTTSTTVPAAVPTKQLPYKWQRDGGSALDLGGGTTTTLSAVLAPATRRGTWLIAGTRLSAGGTTTATVWTSSTATGWTAVTLPGADGRALAATRWGSKTVVVGSVGEGSARRAAVWLSAAAGAPFTAVPASPTLDATAETAPGSNQTTTGGASMDVVGGGTLGVFAAGSSSGRPAMWYSTDGIHWQRVPGADTILDRAADAQVTSILVTVNGVYVGGTVESGTDTNGALWLSSDGISWHAAYPPDNPFAGPNDHAIQDLTTFNGALVAVGAVRAGPSWTPASWISPDGNSWTTPDEAFPEASRPQPGDDAGTVVRAVAATGAKLVAVGGSQAAQRLWTSSDGSAWKEIPLPAAAGSDGWTADLVAATATTTVVVDDQPGDPHVLADGPNGWDDVTAHTATFGAPLAEATPAALIRDGGRLLLAVDLDQPARAIGAAGTRGAVLLESGDGSTWHPVARGGSLAGARIDALTIADGRLVAVGDIDESPGGSPRPAAWTSTSGRRWTLVPSFDSTGGGAATGVAALGTKIVAVGSAGSAGSAAGESPVSWSGSLSHRMGLDAGTTLGSARPLAVCTNGHQVLAVGTETRAVPPPPTAPATGATKSKASAPTTTTTTVPHTGSTASTAGQGDDGAMAAAWSTENGASWETATVLPVSGVGADVRMVGCTGTGHGWIAYGEAPGPRGQDVPTLWSSSNGTAWTELDRPSLAGAANSPFTDLQVEGSTWLAVSGGTAGSGPTPADPATGAPILLTEPTDPMAATSSDGSAGVWVSTDDGAVWDQVATTGAPWDTGLGLETDQVATVGGSLVVAGRVDGRLAVWTGQAG
jgi:hypothetical protein